VAAFPEEFISDADLVIAARKGLYDRSRLLTPEATMEAIQDLKHWIGQELAFEEGASAAFGRILSELWHSEYLDQLPPLLNRFDRLVSAYFVRRGSVPAFHGFCNAWRDGVLRRILQFAEEGPELNDQGHAPAPFALLASGSLGRREQTLEEGECYFLLWSGGAAEAEYFKAFAYRVIAILDQFGLIGKESPAHLGKALWRGNLEEWSGFLAGGSAAPDQPARLETMADLRQLCGDQEIGRAAVLQARFSLARACGSVEFQELAREVAEVPVALGILGGIRVEKTGEYAGCCNPERGGLYPLVSGVRLLAAQSNLDPGPTLDRLAALGSLGVLEGAQVDRLTASYHVLSGLKVRREIALEHPYLDPATLTEPDREKLKAALEAVRQLQRVIRCGFLGKERIPQVSLNSIPT
jgi:CBS domain-containing protein